MYVYILNVYLDDIKMILFFLAGKIKHVVKQVHVKISPPPKHCGF